MQGNRLHKKYRCFSLGRFGGKSSLDDPTNFPSASPRDNFSVISRWFFPESHSKQWYFILELHLTRIDQRWWTWRPSWIVIAVVHSIGTATTDWCVRTADAWATVSLIGTSPPTIARVCQRASSVFSQDQQVDRLQTSSHEQVLECILLFRKKQRESSITHTLIYVFRVFPRFSLLVPRDFDDSHVDLGDRRSRNLLCPSHM